MISKYKSVSRLGKVFIWLSLGIFIAAWAFYIRQVMEALAMDPNSYNCMYDSMMKQICEDPFGTSVFWGMLLFVFLCWPILLVWAVIGIVLIARRSRKHSVKEK